MTRDTEFKAIMLQNLYEPEQSLCNQPRLTGYINQWFCLIKEGEGYYAYRSTLDDPWIPVKSLCRILHYHIEVKKGAKGVASRSVLNIWKQNTSVRTFESLIFDPTFIGESSKAINRFQGFEAARLPTPSTDKSGDADDTTLLQPILYFLHEYLCNKRDDVYEYILSWMAQLIQDPVNKHGIGLCCVGKPGLGKNTFFDHFFAQKILGRYNTMLTSSVEEAIGKHASLEDCLLCILNEVTLKGAKKQANKLKMALTERHLRQQPKYKASKQVNSYTRFIFLSNNILGALDIEADDRRYMIFRTADKPLPPDDFASLLDLMERPEIQGSFYQFLKDRDITDYIPQSYPVSALKDQMRQMSNDAVRFYCEALMSGNYIIQSPYRHMPFQIPISSGQSVTYTLEGLFTDFTLFCKEKRLRQVGINEYFFQIMLENYCSALGGRICVKVDNTDKVPDTEIRTTRTNIRVIEVIAP